MTTDNVVDFAEARARLRGQDEVLIDDTEVVDVSELTVTMNDIVYNVEVSNDVVVVYTDDENATNEDLNFVLSCFYSDEPEDTNEQE